MTDNTNYDALKQQLETRLSSLQSRLQHLKNDAAQAHSGDSAEQAQERENDEVIDAIGIETRHSISDIQSALMRIEDGTYGICGGCGEDIARSRLEAIPEATRCVNCAD